MFIKSPHSRKGRLQNQYKRISKSGKESCLDAKRKEEVEGLEKRISTYQGHLDNMKKPISKGHLYKPFKLSKKEPRLVKAPIGMKNLKMPILLK